MSDAASAEPTPYDDLNHLLRELVDGMRSSLGRDLVGVYLQGSYAVGHFDQHSDVDFVTVVEGPLPPDRVESLQLMHARVFDGPSAWSQTLEGSYFPRETLRDYRRCGELLWYLDNGSRALEQSTHCNTVVVRWTVREHGLILFGPLPRTLVDPIPVAELRAEIAHTMTTWGAEILAQPDRYRNRFYQSFIVLSYCRMLHDLRAGEVSSKRTSAEWARAHLDPSWRDLIDGTWAGRRCPPVAVRTPPDPDDFARTLEFVRYVMELAAEEPG